VLGSNDINSFLYLPQRLVNTPVAILPSEGIALAGSIGSTQIGRAHGQQIETRRAGGAGGGQSGYDVSAGVAIIPVQGVLVQRLGLLCPHAGMTGYDGIRANLILALQDDNVRAIALDIDSPGGEVSSLFDLADLIYNLRGTKPIWAILAESAYSAAYVIASACDRITVPRTGGTGSCGVIWMHVDVSKAIGRKGIAVTLVKYGDRKADGNEFQELSTKAFDRFQADINTLGELLVDTVARNRRLAASKVRRTEAATYFGSQGMDVGFADAVMAPDRALSDLVAKLR
jgi:signal peptide peptidase SppA